MGASIIHGQDLRKEFGETEGGGRSCEIVPMDGGYDFFAYSSVEELVRVGESMGISRDSWPIYYDVPIDAVPFDTVRGQCAVLRRHLSDLDLKVAETRHNWLPVVCKWLKDGEIFVVLE